MDGRKYKDMYVEHMWEVDVLDGMGEDDVIVEKKVAELYKQYYRKPFFSKVLQLIGKTGCITDSIYFPVHPWFIQGLVKVTGQKFVLTLHLNSQRKHG